MTATFGVFGTSVRRKEDPALIEGRGLFTDDIKASGELAASFVRSPFAHARITSIDKAQAEKMSGVRAIFTGDDVRQLGPLLAQVPIGKLRPLLADGVVKHVGEAVAMVVADSAAIARDAADAVFVDYEAMQAVTDPAMAAKDEALVHDDFESNVIHTWEIGEQGPIDDLANRADTVVSSLRMVNQRLIPTAIEPRGVLGQWHHGYDRVTLTSTTQQPHAVAAALASTFGLPGTSSVRVLAPEIGGGFGRGLNVYAEEMLVVFASRELEAPVRWIETRSEASKSTIHGRGWDATATIVSEPDGRFLAYSLVGVADMGAYSQNFTVAIPVLGQFTMPGQYKWEAIHWKIDCVVTHTPTTDAYRGAGRPETTFYVERAVDNHAHEMGMDSLELRKMNYFAPADFPAETLVGMTMDSGDYAANLDALVSLADLDGLRAMQEAAREEGRHIGIGIATYVEACGLAPSGFADAGVSWAGYGLPTAFNESAVVRILPDASATVLTGTGPTGQGHETVWAQLVSDRLALPMERITVLHGDTKDTPVGVGTGGSRSLSVGGVAVAIAADRVREKAAKVAAHMLEASAEDIVFADGTAHVAGSPDRSVPWSEIAATAHQPHKMPQGMEAGLDVTAFFDPSNLTWPFGSHLAVVEVDTETGNVELLRYVGVDDCGNIVNPMIVAGQVHGGVAQGIGQALMEGAVFDGEGNLLTSTLTDYPIPTANDVPFFELGKTVTPSDSNPLGVKGIGEAGTIASTPTIVNAVIDALRPLGVKHIEMPLRSKTVWAAMQEARG